MADLDHQRIRDEQDRTFTPALLDVLRNAPSDSAEWTDAVDSLRRLEDYRSIAPLRAYLENRSKPDAARRAVGKALDAFDLPSSPAVWRSWWHDGDEVLRRHAIGYFDRRDAAVVTSIASSEGHPLRAEALYSLSSGFDETACQAIKVSALRSSDGEVRGAATYAVVWDEPLTAEESLHDLLLDQSLDIAKEAAYALQYYVSLATLDRLRRVRGEVHGDVEAQRAESEQTVIERITFELERLDDAGRVLLPQWVEAVAFVAKPDEPGSSSPTTKRSAPFDPVADQAAFADALATSTGPFGAKVQQLRDIDWGSVPADARDGIVSTLVEHPDPEVRMIATKPLQLWDRTDDLVRLLDDDNFGVAKSAMYWLRFVTPDPRIVNRARAAMDNHGGTPAREALETFVAHADRPLAIAELAQLAATDPRQDMRSDAVYALHALQANDEIDRLMNQLADPPMVNWALHVALLSSDDRHRAARSVLLRLVAVDNIDIAAAAAQALARRDAPGPSAR